MEDLDYKCEIISTSDLWKEPELINTINQLLYDTKMDLIQEEFFLDYLMILVNLSGQMLLLFLPRATPNWLHTFIRNK